MGDIGLPELIVIAVIILLLFGGNKLPEAGRSIGQAIREFKNAMRDTDPTKPAPGAQAETKKDETKA